MNLRTALLAGFFVFIIVFSASAAIPSSLEKTRQKAEAGEPFAQMALALAYLQRQTLVMDDQRAFYWMQKAAEQGLHAAEANLGAMYYYGRGVEPNLTQALRWYKRAGRGGNPGAMFVLGLMYYKGEGGTPSRHEAAAWFRRAAMRGSSNAQLNLGLMYYRGEGVEFSPVRAAAWLSVSAASGNDEAKKAQFLLLGELNQQQRQLAAERASAIQRAVQRHLPDFLMEQVTGFSREIEILD